MSGNTYLPEGSIIGTARNTEYTSSIEGLQKAMEDGAILEALAIRCDENMTLTVDLCGVRGIMERDDVLLPCDGAEIRDIAVITRVGRAVCFKVKEIRREGSRCVPILSRRLAQQECRAKFLLNLTPGDIVDAKVTHMENFGAFVDIGCGIISLLTIDCISVSRISHPKDRFGIGDRIKVVIKSIDYNTGRIFVTHKELLGTWQENANLFSAGQTVAGIVRSIESYGIFVELTPNLAGLAEYRDDVSVGQTAAVYIKSIIPERMKLKLVLIDSYKGELEPSGKAISFDANIGHIDKWIYSPEGATKLIETDFAAT